MDREPGYALWRWRRILAGALGIFTHRIGDPSPIGATFGLSEPTGAVHPSDAAIEDLVARRQAARDAKDWATADALRDELSGLGVVVEDTPAGPIWHLA